MREVTRFFRALRLDTGDDDSTIEVTGPEAGVAGLCVALLARVVWSSYSRGNNSSSHQRPFNWRHEMGGD